MFRNDYSIKCFSFFKKRIFVRNELLRDLISLEVVDHVCLIFIVFKESIKKRFFKTENHISL